MLCAMPKPKRVQSYLIQLRIDDTPGLYGRIQVIGEVQVVTFTSARELNEVLRHFIRTAPSSRTVASRLEDEP